MVLQTVQEERMSTTSYAQSVTMEMFIWLVEGRSMKAEWNTAGMENGELCVMTPGEIEMQQLCVVNWDSQQNV